MMIRSYQSSIKGDRLSLNQRLVSKGLDLADKKEVFFFFFLLFRSFEDSYLSKESLITRLGCDSGTVFPW